MEKVEKIKQEALARDCLDEIIQRIMSDIGPVEFLRHLVNYIMEDPAGADVMPVSDWEPDNSKLIQRAWSILSKE